MIGKRILFTHATFKEAEWEWGTVLDKLLFGGYTRYMVQFNDQILIVDPNHIKMIEG